MNTYGCEYLRRHGFQTKWKFLQHVARKEGLFSTFGATWYALLAGDPVSFRLTRRTLESGLIARTV